jgi:hypothetical protein
LEISAHKAIAEPIVVMKRNTLNLVLLSKNKPPSDSAANLTSMFFAFCLLPFAF